ncbi:MAG: VCBS repeat-containing protein [Microthrixaceae bacterium]
MLLTDVLPSIGNGIATQAVAGDIDRDGELEVVAAAASGQLMAFDPDGTSPFLEWSGLPIGFNWLGAPGVGTNSADTAMTVVAFGGAALGDLDAVPGLDVAAPSTGLARALDTLLPNDQPGDNQLTGWSGLTGAQLRGLPRVTADLAFFVTPAIVDLDGDGSGEIVAGNGVQMLDAVGSGDPGDDAARIPTGWPKLTGGWTIGTPAMGDWDGDGTAEIAITRRDGPLLVWKTPTRSDAVGDWARYGGGPTNSGTPSSGQQPPPSPTGGLGDRSAVYRRTTPAARGVLDHLVRKVHLHAAWAPPRVLPRLSDRNDLGPPPPNAPWSTNFSARRLGTS